MNQRGVIEFAVIAKALLANWQLVVLGVLLLAVGVQTWRLDRAETREKTVQASFDKFKGGIAALGAKAQADALKREKQDKERKEKADAENKQSQDLLQRDNALIRADRDRLRRERDAARSRSVPPTPQGSKCPDGQACFDRALLESALQEHRARIRGRLDDAGRLLEEGSTLEADLNTAKKWAQGR